MKPEKILEGVTVVPLYLAVLLLPTFFLPITTEWFEWNKHYLLGILVVISLLAWLANGLLTKKLTLARAPTDLAMFAWWLVVLISAILAKDRINSFFGLKDNVSWGVLALTFYILLALLIFWNARTEERLKKLLMLIGIGGTLPAVYFWLGRFGLFERLRVPRWNPVAELNVAFGVFLVLVLLLALGILLVRRNGVVTNPRGKSATTLWAVLAAVNFITIVVLGFRNLWLAMAVGTFLILVFSFIRLNEVRYPLVSVSMVLFVLSLVFYLLGTPRFLTVRSPVEITLAHQRSAQITIDTAKEGVVRALFGSGPGTFVYDFSDHRAERYNLSPAWNIRFTRPAATSYQILAETGILGTIAFLVLILVGLGSIVQAWMKYGAKSRRPVRTEEEGAPVRAKGNTELVGVFFALVPVWLTSLVMLFFLAFGTVLWLSFFVSLIMLGLVGQLAGILPERAGALSLKATPQYALATSFVYIIVVAAVVVGGIFLGRFYGADVLAAQAARAAARQDFEGAERLLGGTLGLDTHRVTYPLQLAGTFLRHAAALSREPTPDVGRIGTLVGNAISASRRATVLAPRSVATWEQLAQIYANARPLSSEANPWVITSLNEAIKLESTNPRPYLQRGIAYRIDGKVVEAKADFERAVALKPNYAVAHFSLSLLREAEQDFDGAIASAEAAAQLARRDPDAQFNLGRLLYNRNGEGDWQRAEDTYRRALALNRDHANSLFSLAVLLERQDRVDEARDLYERVLELDSTNETVRTRLRELPAGTPRNVEPAPIREEEIEEEAP